MQLIKRDRLLQLGIDTYKWVARHYTLMPRFVKVETTKACNLKCPGCRRNYSESISTEPGPKHLTVKALQRIIATTPIRVVRFDGDGEPMVNPHFRDLLRFCKQMGIRSAMATNGTLVDEDYVKFMEEQGMIRIHISFDGAEKDTFEKARLGADFDQVLHACKLLGKSKIPLFMSVVLSSAQVVEELPKYSELAKSIGAVGIHLMKFQQESLGFGNPPDLSKYPNALRKFGEDVKNKGMLFVSTCHDLPAFMECDDPFACPYVMLNNDVYACSYTANLRKAEVYMGELIPVPSRNYCMGNLENNWMKDIWKNDAYRELRSTLKKSRFRNGCKLTPEDLLTMKKFWGKSNARFAYCRACLCRWGESGL